MSKGQTKQERWEAGTLQGRKTLYGRDMKPVPNSVVIRVVSKENPKTEGKNPAKRFRFLMEGQPKTVGEYREKYGVTDANDDMAWNSNHGFIMIENFVHPLLPAASPAIDEAAKVEQPSNATAAEQPAETQAERPDEPVARGANPDVLAANDRNRLDAIEDIDTDAQTDRAKFSGYTYVRDATVRDKVKRRAKGCCEYCGKPGFATTGGVYLECHHIIALADDGADRMSNVIALCPDHHREAHFGQRAEELERQMTSIVKEKEWVAASAAS